MNNSDRYQLQEQIGQGGMGKVYKGLDTYFDRVVAIKILSKEHGINPGSIARFEREAKSIGSLEHPNLLRIYDYGQMDNAYFIVTELIKGTNLRNYINSRGILSAERALIITYDIAQGLQAIHHNGIVHRDVKPENILIGSNGSIKLIDFGIACFYKDIDLTQITAIEQVLGTPQYFAPEQAQKKTISPATDIYALGTVMYEMLTGRTPFSGDSYIALATQHILKPPISPRLINPDIPLKLEKIIMRCLEKSPEKRFNDALSLAHALEMLAEDEDENEFLNEAEFMRFIDAVKTFNKEEWIKLIQTIEKLGKEEFMKLIKTT